jgi:hypothetical protein
VLRLRRSTRSRCSLAQGPPTGRSAMTLPQMTTRHTRQGSRILSERSESKDSPNRTRAGDRGGLHVGGSSRPCFAETSQGWAKSPHRHIARSPDHQIPHFALHDLPRPRPRPRPPDRGKGHLPWTVAPTRRSAVCCDSIVAHRSARRTPQHPSIIGPGVHSVRTNASLRVYTRFGRLT